MELGVYHRLRSCRPRLYRPLLKMLWSLCPSGLGHLWRSPSGRICAEIKRSEMVSARVIHVPTVVFVAFVRQSHLSSSSSMKPLLSASSTVKTFFTSSADLAFRPTMSKNFLWSKESATAQTHTPNTYVARKKNQQPQNNSKQLSDGKGRPLQTCL